MNILFVVSFTVFLQLPWLRTDHWVLWLLTETIHSIPNNMWLQYTLLHAVLPLLRLRFYRTGIIFIYSIRLVRDGWDDEVERVYTWLTVFLYPTVPRRFSYNSLNKCLFHVSASLLCVFYRFTYSCCFYVLFFCCTGSCLLCMVYGIYKICIE